MKTWRKRVILLWRKCPVTSQVKWRKFPSLLKQLNNII